MELMLLSYPGSLGSGLSPAPLPQTILNLAIAFQVLVPLTGW